MSNDFLGLPLWKRMYGHGDTGTLEATMLTAFVGNPDRRSLAGMLPEHPTLRLVPGSPLVVVQSDFTRVVDNGDPDRNVYRYHEVMFAAVVSGVGGPLPSLFPLVLFVDDPLIMASGREFYGFPKVMGEVILEPRRAIVRHTSFPGGVRTTRDVMRATWSDREPLAGHVVASAARVLGILALAGPIGRVMNLRQLPDLEHPRRATRSELTLFSPKIVEPKLLATIADHRLELPDDPVWSLGRRLLGGAPPKTMLAFEWQATFIVTTGRVVDAW